MVSNFVRYYDELPLERRKVLVIMNHWHAFGRYTIAGLKSFWHQINQKSDLKIANVFIHNFASDDEDHYRLIQNGKWDAAFTKMGIDGVGFDFSKSPFGDDKFDYETDHRTDLKYRDHFTGMIYLRLDNCKYVWGVPGIITDEFLPEITRRHQIVGYPTDKDSIVEWYNKFNVETYSDYEVDLLKN